MAGLARNDVNTITPKTASRKIKVLSESEVNTESEEPNETENW
jgi:hypothetical protein